MTRSFARRVLPLVAASAALVGAVGALPVDQPTAPANDGLMLPGVPDLGWLDSRSDAPALTVTPPFALRVGAGTSPARRSAKTEPESAAVEIALRGVFIAGKRRTALVVTGSDEVPRWISIGDQLNGEEVVVIEPDRIALGRGERRRTVPLTQTPPPKGDPE